MSYVLLAVIAAFLFYLGLRWFVTAEPARVVFVARALAISIAMVVGLLMIVTGRLGMLYMLGALVLPMAMAWYRRRRATAGGFDDPFRRQRGKSEIETPWLRMELDVDSERIDGRVLQGSFAGKSLSELDQEQLLALWRESGSEVDTARLLEAYLDRRLGGGWRRQERPQATRTAMTREEALEILGLKDGAGPDEIKAAHRRLMAQVHPDKGGSTYLAAKINQARDFLLGD